MDVQDSVPSSLGLKFKVEVFMLVILTVLTVSQIVFKDAFLTLADPVIGKISLVIALSNAAILPGLVYKGGDWYTKLFRGEKFTTSEKAFLIFAVEVGIAILLAVLVQQLIQQLFPKFIKYAWILFVEWFLLLYVWFTRLKHYSFPWFYLIATNILLAIFAYVTYKYA